MIVRARIEGAAGTAGWTAAPFGPLYAVVADELRARAASGALGGVGGAAVVGMEMNGSEASLATRVRPGLGTELDGRLATRLGPIEVAGWLAAESEPVAREAIEAEARVQLSSRLHAGLEVGRLYRRDLGLDGSRGMWHALAWFGVDLSR